MLTQKQHELLCFIDEKLKDSGVSPSFEEMKEALGLKSKSGIHRLISALEERHFIRRLPNRARALEVLKLPEGGVQEAAPSNVVSLHPETPVREVISNPAPAANNDVLEIPLHGRIAAGAPIEAMEGQSALSVPAALLGPGEHYALEVSGDSMIDAGILDGDYALIQKTEVARDGEIVVALIHEEEATLKYLRKDGRSIRLDPANAAYEPQIYGEGEVRIQGKMAGLLRRY
ncbi:transcriptional repressor LexA [Sphingorhabdus sp. M41]|uniref:transcriptional repressor LexA n=1 Tax=Sphingorhabdus sp. M41 TaxID=1806885 RepID=UPI00078D6C27|nr:transcriptional repressor LexA [Sphingorhabdus sp. M41]AMO71504.1 LexA family transcriptional regulator [Sphingorhabdus sp. M41]